LIEIIYKILREDDFVSVVSQKVRNVGLVLFDLWSHSGGSGVLKGDGADERESPEIRSISTSKHHNGS